MFFLKDKRKIEAVEDERAKLQAVVVSLARSMAVLELSTDGVVLAANDNFARLLGYLEHELPGLRHETLCEASYVRSQAYRTFWSDLRAGKIVQGRFERRSKSGEVVWLEATYTPIIDERTGTIVKLMKFASDVTQSVLEASRMRAIVDALERSMAVIEFSPDGTVIRANDNFLQIMGYTEVEIVGQHHSIF